jgi:F-type H+-transporting ATPase subunit b
MNETTSMPAPHEGGAQLGSVLAVSDTMVGLTWLAFLIACFALYKLAWKPICQALDRREDKIRQSLKEAADIQAQAAMDKEGQRMLLEEAKGEAAAIVERARAAAEATARAMEAKSRADAESLIRDAGTEIAQAKEKALGELRREASGLALQLAGRVIGQKLDAAADRELTDRLIQDMK